MCRDNNHSRPADVLVECWERGQPAALDITVSLKESSRFAGVAALSAEMRKHAANDPKCTGGRRPNTCSLDWLPI